MDSQSYRGGGQEARIRFTDRLDALVRHPKRLVVAIVAVLVAAGAAVGSSAVLTSSSTNPGNSFHASNLNVSNDNSGVISVSGMHPGDNQSGTLTITNDGDLPASAMDLDVALTGDTAPNTGHIASVLTATITDTTGGGSTQVYSGPASTMPTQNLGPFAAGEARTYSVQLRFPSTADNTFQLSTASFNYTWKATQ